MTIWWTMGFNSVVYLAGLQGVDQSLYDAAKVDGAGPWQEFWHVTLPGLRPVMLFVVTMTILASANMFGQSYLLTSGNLVERDPDRDHVHRAGRAGAVPDRRRLGHEAIRSP